MLAILILGFVAGEIIKAVLISKEWNFYQDDFGWVRKNTGKNSVFVAGGQCMSYNLDRFTLNPAKGNFGKADYVFVNQNFNLELRLCPHCR